MYTRKEMEDAVTYGTPTVSMIEQLLAENDTLRGLLIPTPKRPMTADEKLALMDSEISSALALIKGGMPETAAHRLEQTLAKIGGAL